MSKSARGVGEKNWDGDDPATEAFSPLTDWRKKEEPTSHTRLRVEMVDAAMYEVVDRSDGNVYEVAVTADVTLEIVEPENVSDCTKKMIIAAVDKYRSSIFS